MEGVHVKIEPPSLSDEGDDPSGSTGYVDGYQSYVAQYSYHGNHSTFKGSAPEQNHSNFNAKVNERQATPCDNLPLHNQVAAQYNMDESTDEEEFSANTEVNKTAEALSNDVMEHEGNSNEQFNISNKIIKSEPVDDYVEDNSELTSMTCGSDEPNAEETMSDSEDTYPMPTGFQLLRNIKREAGVHDGYKMYSNSNCDYPQSEGVTALDFSMTSSRHSNNAAKLFACTFEGCKKRFKSNRALSSHASFHTMEKKFPCPHQGCGKAFVSEANLKIHVNTHQAKKYDCDHPGCKMKYKLLEHLEKHRAIHTMINPYGCPDCARQFVDNSSLHKHMRNSHSTNELLYCPIDGCDKTFRLQHSLTQHMNKPHGPFICTVEGCGREFLTLKTMKVHVRIIHGDARRFVCEFPGCGRGFKVADSRRKHMISHSTERKEICLQCGAAFKYEHSLKKHMAIHDSSVYKYHCSVGTCQMAYHTPGELRNHHDRKHTDTDNWSCEVCGKGFKCKNNYLAHVRIHADKSSYKHACSKEGCGMKFRLKRYLMSHMAQHERPKGPFLCHVDGCRKLFYMNRSFETHLVSHVTNIVCPIRGCGRKYLAHSALKKHIRIHIQRDEGDFTNHCPFQGCSAAVNNLCQLKDHVMVAHAVMETGREIIVKGKKQIQEVIVLHCPVITCDSTRDNYHTWLSHYSNAHGNIWFKHAKFIWPNKNPAANSTKSFDFLEKKMRKKAICDICGKELSHISSLRRHIKFMHEGLRPFVCEEPDCGKSFKIRLALRIHSIVHTNECRYKCKYPGCTKIYRNPNSLSAHKRKHDKSYKPRYICKAPDCNKIYHSDTAFRMHVRTHTNPGSNICSVCGKVLADSHSLSRHMGTHSGRRTVACLTCGKKFYSDYYLRLHQRYHVVGKRYKCTHADCDSTFHYPCNLRHHLQKVHNGVNGTEPQNAIGANKTHPDDKKPAKPANQTPRKIPSLDKKRTLECEFCGKMFMWRRNIVKHMSVFHGVDSQTSLTEGDNVPAFNTTEMDNSEGLASWDSRGQPNTSWEMNTSWDQPSASWGNSLEPSALWDAKDNSLDVKSLKPAKQLQNHASVHTESQRYSCTHPGCNETYTQPDNLDVHFRSHTVGSESEINVQVLTCNYPGCDRVFQSESSYQYHQSTHSNLDIFKCTICSKTMADNNSLIRHMIAHENRPMVTHDSRTIACKTCGKIFSSESYLTQHQRDHALGKNHVCTRPECNAMFHYACNLRQHVQKVHSGNLDTRPPPGYTALDKLCPFEGCYKRFAENSTLSKHIAMVHHVEMKRSVICPVVSCTHMFMCRRGAFRHMSKVHGIDNPQEMYYKMCGERTPTSRLMDNETVPDGYNSDVDADSAANEINLHPTASWYSTGPAKASWEGDQRPNASWDESQLPLDLSCTGDDISNENSPVTGETGSAGDESYDSTSQADASWDGSCHGDAFLDKDDDSQNKPADFICTICNIVFKDAVNIRNHTHEEGCSFKCLHDDCDKVFESVHKLRRHRNYHMVKNRHVCKMAECTASFAFPYLLRRHLMEVHDTNRAQRGRSDVIPCQVENCGKIFAFQATLVKHMKTAHNDKRQQDMGCAIEGCNRRFMYYATAKRHMREIHGVEFPPEPLRLSVSPLETQESAQDMSNPLVQLQDDVSSDTVDYSDEALAMENQPSMSTENDASWDNMETSGNVNIVAK